MSVMRSKHSSEFKSKVALSALKGDRTINELASLYAVHPNLVKAWKKQAQEDLPMLFENKRASGSKDDNKLTEELYCQIGRLKVELDWLKKNLSYKASYKRKLVDHNHLQITISRQCELLGLSRSALYYKSAPASVENLKFMELLDEEYTRHPFLGVVKLTYWLKKQGYENIGTRKVRRLLRQMGIMAIYPKPNLSKPAPENRIYPYLLRGIKIERVNQVWSTDITYIRLKNGFVYLVAIIDWHSRYVLSHRISITLETGFCIDALQEALEQKTPEIFNSDQGSQFTSLRYTSILEEANIKISMDGRGRALDNIFVERLWRSLKYEDIYLNQYETVAEVKAGIKKYFDYYNNERQHETLGYKTPAEIFFEKRFE